MNSLKSNKVAIHLKLFKSMGFYHLLDPNCKKVFNFNVYRLTLVFFNIIFLCLTIYGNFGYFIEMDDYTDDITTMMTTYVDIMFFSISLKIIVFVYNADKIWDVFVVARIHFLISNKCRKNIYILQKYKKLSTKITQIISIVSIGTVIIWSVLPLVYNMTFSHKINQRMGNILNCRFPLTVYTYNNYFILLYIIEFAVLSFGVFVFLANDVFIISFGFVIMAQYEIIIKAFENIGYEEHTAQSVDGKYNIVVKNIDKCKKIS